MSKRVFDIAVAATGLLVVSPLLLVIALLIALDSKGPVLFRQRRIGKNGHPFSILKFRTMVVNAAAIGPRLTQKRDPRITHLGQILRWLKLDELPQLLNVLRGDMSLVGPRPEDPYFVARYTPEQREVLVVRPGIVGPNQILGRDELEKYPDDVGDSEQYYLEHILPEKLAIDLEYVRSCTLWRDLRLIAGALAVTVFGAFKAKFFRVKREAIALLAADTVASVVVYAAAYGVKFDWTLEGAAAPYLTVVTALILLIRPPVFIYFGLYQNILRYLGTKEFLAIVRAVTVGSVAVSAMTFMLGFGSHSRAVFLVDWGLLILVLFSTRVALKSRLESRRFASPVKSVLIVGADDTGSQLVRTLSEHGMPYRPLGFLDDDRAKHGAIIHGVQVLGAVSDLPVVAALHSIDMVVVLFSRVGSKALRQVIDFCRARGLDYRLLPTLDRLLDGDVVPPELSGLGIDGVGAGHVSPVEHKPRESVRVTPDNGYAAAPASARRAADDRVVLVTGGAGYVGSHVVRKLLVRGRRVRVLDSYLYGDHGLSEVVGHPRLELIAGDIRHLRTVALATRGVHSVIALAALVGDAACDLDVDETVSINLDATRLLAEACENAGVARLVFASSCSVYGANSELTLNEGSWLNPVSLYAQTRIQSEQILLRRLDRLSTVILRLATVFGWSTRMRLDLVVNTLTAHAFFQGKLRLFGGDQWRPNVHVQDVAEAFIAAADADDARVRGEIFNVGGDHLNYRVQQLAEIVRAHVPQVEIEVLATATDRRDYRVSFDKIRHVLGFRPRFTVEAGVAELLRAFEARQITAPEAHHYHNAKHLQNRGFVDAGRLRLVANGVV
jgi:lipopolysaccharide/colanic/teichoic acid biosynthesis glycosyltransferase/nucleoside-diphosphate-sugar epimerase